MVLPRRHQVFAEVGEVQEIPEVGQVVLQVVEQVEEQMAVVLAQVEQEVDQVLQQQRHQDRINQASQALVSRAQHQAQLHRHPRVHPVHHQHQIKIPGQIREVLLAQPAQAQVAHLTQ